MNYETPDLSDDMDHGSTYTQYAGLSCTDDRIYPGFNQSHACKLDEEEPHTDVSGKRHVKTQRLEDFPYGYPLGNCTITTFECSGEAQPAETALRHHIKTNLPAQLVTDEYGEQCELSEIISTKLAALQAKLWRELPRVEAAGLTLDQSADCTTHDMLSADDHVFVLGTSQPRTCSFELCSLLHETFQLPYEPHQIAVEPTFDLSTLTPAIDYDQFSGRILVFTRDRYKYMEYGQPLKEFFPKPIKTFCRECLVHLWNKRVHAWEIIDNHGLQEENASQRSYPSQAAAVAESHEDYASWSSDITAVPDALLDACPSDKSDDGGVSVVTITSSEHAHLLDCLDSIDQDTDTVEVKFPQSADLEQGQQIEHRGLDALGLDVKTTEEITDDAVSSGRDDAMLQITDDSHQVCLPYLQLDGADDMQDQDGSLSRSLSRSLSLSLSDGRNSVRGSEARPAKLAIRMSEPKLPRSTSAPIITHKETTTTTTAAHSTMLSIRATPRPGSPSETSKGDADAEEEMTWHEFLQAQATSSEAESVQSDFDKKSHYELYKSMHINAPIQPPNPMEINGLVFPMPPTVDLGPVYLGRPRTKPLDMKQGRIMREDIFSKAEKAGTARKYQLRATEQQTIDYWLSPGNQISAGIWSASVPSALRALSVNVRKSLVPGPVRPSVSPVKSQKKGSPFKQVLSLFTPRSSPVKQTFRESPLGASSYLVMEEDEPANSMTKTKSNSKLASMDFLKNFREPVFCYCRRPNDGKKMVECSNPNCSYGWFHHACLSKPEKLSCTSKTRPWTCQVCKLYKIAQTAPSSIDFHFPFLKEEILDALAVPGPNATVPRNPYGLGLHDPYNVGLPEQSQVSGSEDRDYYGEDEADEEDEEDKTSGMEELITEEEVRDSGYYAGDDMVEDSS